ncbi:hypothetical protein ESCAB7627_2798 [Escherichia albertii TW07627]|uniref:Uncharacterized protein n=1 Tax=Escherichia albertii (strain TW07627) TaxID=502347 RepID=A0ABC9NLV4_ESCAT|nr:hypothetical protein EAKF1_ch0141 [Escherichia albertii KF1]EDS91204.1 hypothetical protein ESCAB7627_2798 [Escherichia albertii TW07627]
MVDNIKFMSVREKKLIATCCRQIINHLDATNSGTDKTV